MYVHVHMCVCVDVCHRVREKDSAFLLSCGFLGAQVVRYEASAFSPLSHPMAPVFSDFFFAWKIMALLIIINYGFISLTGLLNPKATKVVVSKSQDNPMVFLICKKKPWLPKIRDNIHNGVGGKAT